MLLHKQERPSESSAGREDLLVSIVIVTRNEERNIGRCLENVFSQKVPFQFEVTVIDSASEDRTREIAARFPINLIRIEKEQFQHGRTRNMGAELSQGDVLVYLQGDAWPADDQWLRNLLDPLLDDPSLAAVYGRQVPKEDCDPINRFRYGWNYPAERVIKEAEKKEDFQHRLYFFSTANCAIRRAVWEEIRFPEDIPIFEDMTFAKLAISRGMRILYEPTATVVHSHNLGIKQIFHRYRLVAKIQTRYRFTSHAGRNFLAEGARYVAAGVWKVFHLGGPLWLFRFLLHASIGYGGLLVGRLQGLVAAKTRPEGDPIRVHLITNLFAPDQLAGAALYTDFAEYFRERGFDIRVTTTFPYYPAWSLRPEDSGISVREEDHRGIPVRRIKMWIPARPTGFRRMISDLSFLLSLTWRGRFRDWTPDVVVTASPMLSQCMAQRFLYLGKGIPRLIIVQDFVVDAALELRILNAPLLKPLLRVMERWSLRSASTLSTISDPMLKKLQGVIGADRRLDLIPNWIHGSLEKMVEQVREQQLPRAERQLFYSGNVGVKQGLPAFLPLFPDPWKGWKLLINGGGAEIANLRHVCDARSNVIVGGVLSEEDYIKTLLTSTACLITQRPGVGANFLPSKLLPALATGTPVLAVCDHDSPLGREVKEGEFGVVIDPGDGEALRETLERWAREPEELTGLARNALARSALYRGETILAKYEMELRRLVGSPQLAELPLAREQRA